MIIETTIETILGACIFSFVLTFVIGFFLIALTQLRKINLKKRKSFNHKLASAKIKDHNAASYSKNQEAVDGESALKTFNRR